ncbi:MAG: hypothetical protein ACRCYX_12100 [Dermatophilaceae bacterium]
MATEALEQMRVDEVSREPIAVRPSLLSRAGRRALAALALRHPVWTLLLVYVASRLWSLFAVWLAATSFQNPSGVGNLDPELSDMPELWDGAWYRRIAEDGYPPDLARDPENGRFAYSEWAFYPLYPLLVRALMVTGVSFTSAAIMLNVVLGAVATLLIWAVLRTTEHAERQPERERLAIVAAGLWCLYPATPILGMPYTEALGAVLVAGSVLLLIRRRYVAVAGLALALGFTRGVAPALGVAVVIHLVARWRDERGYGGRFLAGERWRIAILLAAVAAATVAWPTVAGVATGRPTAFVDVQSAWGQRPEAGPFVQWLEWAWVSKGVGGVVVLVALVATYIALVLGRHGRWISVEARAWALAYPLYLVAVVRPITSMWRFLLLDFPIAALLSSVAMRTASGRSIAPHWPRRVAFVVVVLGGAVLVYSASFLTRVPWGDQPP